MSVFKLVFDDHVRRFPAPAQVTFAILKKAFTDSFPPIAGASPSDLRITCIIHNQPEPNTQVVANKKDKESDTVADSSSVISFAVYDDASLAMALENFKRTDTSGRKLKFVGRIVNEVEDESGWDMVADSSGEKIISPGLDDTDGEVIEAPDMSEERVQSEPAAEKPTAVMAHSLQISHPNWLAGSSGPSKADAAKVEEKQLEIDQFHYFCKKCNSSIGGIRYKCLYCTNPSYQICQKCETELTSEVEAYMIWYRRVHSDDDPSDLDNRNSHEKSSHIPNGDSKQQPDGHRDHSPPFHDPFHPFIRILNAEQCPDTGVMAKRIKTNPFGVVIVKSIGVPHGSTVQVGERFFAGWKVMNQSDKPWHIGWKLKFVKGDDMRIDRKDISITSEVRPGESVDVLMEMSVLPDHSGKVCRGFYRLSTPEHQLVGPPMEYEVRVSKSNSQAKPAAPSPAEVKSNASPSVSAPPRPRLSAEEQRFQGELDCLRGMGFSDISKTMPLLKSGKNVQQIVEILLR